MNDSEGQVVREIHTLYAVGSFVGLGDHQLLERFAAREGEAADLAFAALVDRHGPMVLRVCRRLLRNPHDADDAFQATFLVLARKASSLRDHGSVGNWLYGVAIRVSADARAATWRRERHERRYSENKEDWIADDHARRDLGTLLHEELARLPERYRAPLVLCHLEGLSHEEAAVCLGRPVGTVRSRLARGRERLRSRLERRGFEMPVAALAAAIAGEAEATPVPQVLVDSTLKAATRLAAGPAAAAVALATPGAARLFHGAMRHMILSKLSNIAILCVAAGGVLAAGAGVAARQKDGEPAQAKAKAKESPVEKADPGAAPRGRVVRTQLPIRLRATVVSLRPAGTRVKKGDVLCEVKSAVTSDQVEDRVQAAEIAKAAYETARRTREIAEIARVEFDSGIAKLELEELLGAISLADGERKIAEQEMAAVQQVPKVSPLLVQKAQLNFRRAVFAFERATSKHDFFRRFTMPKESKRLGAEIDNARSQETVLKTKWHREAARAQSIKDESAPRQLNAPADGLLTHVPSIVEGLTVQDQNLLFEILTDEPADSPP